MYNTVSKEVRNGWGMINSGGSTHFLGEITYPPFGFIYALDSEPIRNDFFEITNFKKFKFNQTLQTRIDLPFLTPKTYIPGLYHI
jgi:hypothetical protein